MEECSARARLVLTIDGRRLQGWALWYPQMGGYLGRAFAVPASGDSDPCWDVYVWHDGEFPFSEVDGSPALIHHCMAEQFVTFGESLLSFTEPTDG